MIRNISRVCTLALLISTVTPAFTGKANPVRITQIGIGIPTTLVGIFAWYLSYKTNEAGKKESPDTWSVERSFRKDLMGYSALFGTFLIASGLANLIKSK